MASPSSSLATLRPELAATFMEFDLEADRQGFIGHRVLPIIQVGKSAGTFGKIPIEELLKPRNTGRAARGGYSRQNFEFTTDSYTTSEHGAEEVVDDNESENYRDYFDHELVSAQRARDAVLRNAEIRIADAVFNANTFTPQTVTNEWDDYANATPLTDVETAVQAVYDATGVWPNALIINKRVFRNLRNCAEIIDRIKYSGRDGVKASEINAAMLADLFDLEEVIVGGAAKNTAAEGQSASLSPIWSDEYAMVTRISSSPDLSDPGLGRTPHWDADGSMPLGTVESYREEQSRGDVIRVRHQVGEKLIYPEISKLLDNITT